MDGYFETMGVKRLAGRTVAEHDRQGAVPVAVVNETLASRLWPNRDLASVVGQRVRIGPVTGPANEVIGVVASVRSRRPDALPDPEVYVSFHQLPSPTMSYVVRASGDPSALTGQIRSALRQMTPHVAQRTRELAIRSAVGASRAMLLGVVVREGFTLSMAGMTIVGINGSMVNGTPLIQTLARRGSKHSPLGQRGFPPPAQPSLGFCADLTTRGPMQQLSPRASAPPARWWVRFSVTGAGRTCPVPMPSLRVDHPGCATTAAGSATCQLPANGCQLGRPPSYLPATTTTPAGASACAAGILDRWLGGRMGISGGY